MLTPQQVAFLAEKGVLNRGASPGAPLTPQQHVLAARAYSDAVSKHAIGAQRAASEHAAAVRSGALEQAAEAKKNLLQARQAMAYHQDQQAHHENSAGLMKQPSPKDRETIFKEAILPSVVASLKPMGGKDATD